MRLAVGMWEVREDWGFCGLGASVEGLMGGGETFEKGVGSLVVWAGEEGDFEGVMGRRWRGRAEMIVSWTEESGEVVSGSGRMFWWGCE